MGGYQIVQHTADLCIRVWGKSWKDLLEESARGMMSQIIPMETVEENDSSELVVQGENGEELLLNWLREILFLVEGGMVFSSFCIHENNFSEKEKGKYRFHAALGGEKLDPARHDICTEIKAVTRHGLSLKQRGSWWETSILFDV